MRQLLDKTQTPIYEPMHTYTNGRRGSQVNGEIWVLLVVSEIVFFQEGIFRLLFCCTLYVLHMRRFSGSIDSI